MTANQIAYQKMLAEDSRGRTANRETRRSNLARERENERSNLVREAETMRSNLINEDLKRQSTAAEVSLKREQASKAREEARIERAKAYEAEYGLPERAALNLVSLRNQTAASEHAEDLIKSQVFTNYARPAVDLGTSIGKLVALGG